MARKAQINKNSSNSRIDKTSFF